MFARLGADSQPPPSDGSSRIISRGSLMRYLVIASICRPPPDSISGLRLRPGAAHWILYPIYDIEILVGVNAIRTCVWIEMSNTIGDQLVSAQQAIHAKLRSMILSGEFLAGQPLRQEEIARLLGVSRLPVREALNRLSIEGLVELKPRRGFFVTSLNAGEIEDIFDMRAMLEERAGQLATTRRTAADVQALDALVDALEDALTRPAPFETWADLNLRFHTQLYQSCGRKHLRRQIDLLRDNVAPLIRVLAQQEGELRRSQEEHRRMAELFRAGEAAAVGRLCREHCTYTARSLIKLLRSAPDARPESDPKAA